MSQSRKIHSPWRVSELTRRELEVLTYVASGASNVEIAAALFLGEATVKTHVSHMLTKLGQRDRVGLVAWAFRHGVVAADRPPSSREEN